MTFPSKTFLLITIGVLTLGVAVLALVVYEQAHVITAQRQLMIDMFQYIVSGCPITQ